ncbi:MAG: hypothetical protein HFJ06_03025 [Lachnospiraceae bacterium]|nr:hypothetical protein [Lachnospiraceae bacterium]
MKSYYFNDNTDNHGYNEIHTEDCSYLPSVFNRTYIGDFASCQDAMSAAKIQYPSKTFDGCYYCCRECHKG